MTDEEIDRMADNFVNTQKFTEVYGVARKAECGAFWKYGFLAGLKAGRPQWHDLQKNPTDVPEENVTVLLLTEVEPVTARYNSKYEAFFRLNDKLDYCVFIAPMSYIAWCEIPKYTQE